MEKTLVPWHPMWIPSVSGPAFFVPHFVRPTPPNKTEQNYADLSLSPSSSKGFFLDNVGISHIQLSYSKMAGWWWLEPNHGILTPWHPCARQWYRKVAFAFLRPAKPGKVHKQRQPLDGFYHGFFRKKYWNTIEWVEFPNLKWWNPQCPSVWILVHLVLTGWCFHARQWVQKAEAILIQHGKPRP